MHRLKCMIASMLCFCFIGGCAPLFLFGAGTAVGVAGYKFYHGTLTVIFQAPFMETWDATLKALKEMNMKISLSEHDMTSGKIVARKADNTPVNISIKYKTFKETEAIIRVGPLGDKNASEAIKGKIRAVLFGK